MKVAIAQPVYGHLSGMAHISYTQLIGQGVAKGLVSDLITEWASYISHARNRICTKVLDESEADSLLFVDQDMIMPEGILERLIEHDVPVVGAVYFGRAWPHGPVAFDLPFKMLDEPGDKLHQVGGVGMGCTLIKREVLAAVRYKFGPVWFDLIPGNGEDVSFALRCQELGIPIWLDSSAENECGHVADVVITRHQYQYALDDKVADG